MIGIFYNMEAELFLKEIKNYKKNDQHFTLDHLIAFYHSENVTNKDG